MSKFLLTRGIVALALGVGHAACSSDVAFEEGDEVGEVQFETIEEPLFFTKPGACNNYEAENIGRAGGSAASGGWKLAAAVDNINVNRQFVAGEHQFTIIARGTAGDGQKPQLRLTLNGIQIGSNIVVTNTAITDGWKEYVVTYSVGTANNKLIKVELVNPGSGRSVVIDGLSVYCPRIGVTCNGASGCSACCSATNSCESCGAGTIACDQNSDCSNGDICALKGVAFNGYAIGCHPKPVCDEHATIAGAACGEICKTPYGPEKACSDGKVCADMSTGTLFNLPGWKFCTIP